MREKRINFSTGDRAAFIGLAVLCLFVSLAPRLKPDIALWDELIFLNRGTLGRYPEHELIVSPLYIAWYQGLALFTADPITLFYLSYYAIVAGFSAALYFCCRGFDARPAAAFGAAALMLLGPSAWSGVRNSTFGTLCLLTCLALAATRRQPIANNLLLLGLALFTLCRPEFELALLLYMGWSLYGAWRWNHGRVRTYLVGFIGLLLFIGATQLSSAERSNLAFAQGFARNFVAWNHLDVNPWFEKDRILAEVFPGYTTVFSAPVVNPQAFFHHFVTNAGQYLLTSALDLLPFVRSLCPVSVQALAAAVLLGGIATYLLLHRAVFSERPALRLILAAFIPTVAAVAIPSAAISHLQRYVVPQHALLLVMLASVFSASRIGKRFPRADAAIIALTTGVVLAVLLVRTRRPVDFPTLTLAQHLRTVELPKPLVMYELLGGVCRYADPHCEHRFPLDFAPDMTAEQLFQKFHVNSVILDDAARNDPARSRDVFWQRLTRNPPNRGLSTLQWAR